MAQELITYGDIISSVLEKLGIQSTDALANSRVKRAINEIYLDEIIPFKPWVWLEKTIQVIHLPAFTTGTCAVVQNSATVTLSTAPTGLGSFQNYRFALSESDTAQVYTVATHTADSTSLTLTTAYQEPSNATASLQIWRDRFDLPVNARETTTIWHTGQDTPLNPIGPKEFREKEAMAPTAQGFPTDYNTWDFFDPTTSGDDETNAVRFRQTRIWPSITETQQAIILNVDYVEDATALDDALDEPLIPVGDRISLFYGALALCYSMIARDEDMHDRYWMKFQQKLARMAANRDEGQDTPRLAPKATYINRIRRSGLGRNGFNT